MYESRLHPNPSKKFPYTIIWHSWIPYWTGKSVKYPEQTEFTTIEEVIEICKEQNLQGKIYDQRGCEIGTAHEDGVFDVY